MRYILPLRRFLWEVGTQLNMEFVSPATMHSTVFEDKNGALGLAESPRKHPSTHHIAVKYMSESEGVSLSISRTRNPNGNEKGNKFDESNSRD